jgi:hypothetical protein
MKKITLVAGLALILVLPTVAVAKPTPDRGDKRAAKSECNMFRGHSDATREAFAIKFGTFRACVKARAADEAKEEQSAHTNAAKECKAEGLHGREFGKCVSEKAKAKEKAADAKDQQEATEFKNAAKACDDERGDTTESREAFKQQYGTNTNKSNAFGKCVSQKAKAQHDENEGETETPPAS